MFLRDTGPIDDSFTIIKNPAEPLRLAMIEVKDGQAIARWKSVPDQSYQVQRTTDLESAQCLPASDRLIAISSNTSGTNSVPTGENKSFYPVVQMEP